MKKEDKFILSKGHAVPALYVVLNYIKKLADSDLQMFHKNGTKYPAHPPASLDVSVPFPSGSLGHGLSIASGIAQGYSFLFSKNKIPKVYCLLSDGECNEGQVWEAAQYASAKQISNLIVMIDKNGLQAFGKTSEVLGESASVERWRAFGFETYECDGHDVKKIKKNILKAIQSRSNKPKVIIFSTIKGYGVSFMENTLEWHYHTLTEELYNEAIQSIDKKIKD